jgi:hypothetical protein
MKKLYIIKSNANGKTIWCGIGKSHYKHGIFSKYWIRSSFQDVTRFNFFQVLFVWIYLKITHGWMKRLKIKLYEY